MSDEPYSEQDINFVQQIFKDFEAEIRVQVRLLATESRSRFPIELGISEDDGVRVGPYIEALHYWRDAYRENQATLNLTTRSFALFEDELNRLINETRELIKEDEHRKQHDSGRQAQVFRIIHDVDYHYDIRSDLNFVSIVLHGFTGNSRNFTSLSPLIKQIRHFKNCLIPEIIGHGMTDSPTDAARYQMEFSARDIVALHDEIFADPYRPLPQFDLLGYSMGGRLALYIAIHYPKRVRALVLESGSPGLKTEDERAARRASDEKLAQMIERDGIEAFVNYWEALPLWDSQKYLAPEIRQQLRQQRLKNNPVGLANSLRGMGTGAQPSLWDKLPELNMPVLLIVGELDTKFVAIAQEMHALLPNSRLVIIPNAGHTVHLEQPELYTKAIGEFLATIL